MSDLKDALARARSEAQDLHKKIQATTDKDHSAIRTDLENAGQSAQNLATNLKSIVAGQRGDAVGHVKDAAAQLEDAAKHARELTGATGEQIKQQNRAMLDKVRDSLQSLSEAVAAQRSKMVKA
jgi:hypothetical protein